ncbi:6-phosphogluconate dehydrogenase, decarboxylating [Sphaerochaeta pleomorpha str. Grapes]|uniref:6-phosphogluconate dehydrogenase, decarboxylating n=1 Tax=Sphaerochaeta pleomorpha (strain ATCC BAA-1885 / DSM 22778 / Grapes) TaxID=158190 RepID=G8QV15_SPHPG|nr:decarboxylating NADP(+)-dependent phosphogluconate dehydrogenase [Sphaerochaeta pleomorpha]AEV29251.1 6-phosphogluconate dehydrogenase, decarboxylating [Sphaerochaeta pleomorpha str. Grapes]
MKSSIGLIGLAVMGENLVLNLESKGYSVAVYNRTTSKVDSFIQGRAKGKHITGTYSLEELVENLESPRKVMMMVKAGEAVDKTIEALIPLLDKGDIIIDGGNSNYEDTGRRLKYVESKQLLYIGTGVSGGEEGALKGPSIMPGGSPEAWPLVKPIFQAISAKVGEVPCCDWIGKGGAGHFVKMVHNGIEYGDMELICEIYDIMRKLLQLDPKKMEQVFSEWNKSVLDSYLIEITKDIMAFMDEDGTPLVDHILDSAGQKGTGKWTGIEALKAGVPLTLIVESVFARSVSSQREERLVASKVFPATAITPVEDQQTFITMLEKALYAAKIISYAQGFALIKSAGETNDWDLDLGNIALLWRGGCIIRSAFLDKISKAFMSKKDLPNLILDPYFLKILMENQESLRKVVATAILNGIPTPSLSAALSWFDSYRCDNLPANLLQAQRDYFGAHTYERIDKKRGEFFHTNWTGHGGETVSTTYSI